MGNAWDPKCKRAASLQPSYIVNDFISFTRALKQRRDIAELPDKPELPAIDRRRRPVPSEGVLDRYLAATPSTSAGSSCCVAATA